MDRVKISIITVVFNDVGHIESTILNVLKQTYGNIEYIIVDGGSNDGTLDIIKRYETKLKWISEPDRGIYDAMMKGVKIASGEWILFRNSGDFFFSPTVVERVFSGYIDNKEDFIIADSRIFNNFGYKDIKPSILSQSYFEDMPVLHPSTFIRRSTQLEYPFRLIYRNSADYCFFVEAFKEGATFRYFNMIVSIIDCREGATADHYDQTIKENIHFLSRYGASQMRIKGLKKSLLINNLASIVTPMIPFYRWWHNHRLKQKGWIKADVRDVLMDV